MIKIFYMFNIKSKKYNKNNILYLKNIFFKIVSIYIIILITSYINNIKIIYLIKMNETSL